jgi:hypothetical protein
LKKLENVNWLNLLNTSFVFKIIFPFLRVDTSTLSVHNADSSFSSFFKMAGELAFFFML